MEQHSFKGKAKASSTSLIIGKQQKKLLTRHQETFNILVKRIEKLRSELERVGKSLDEKLDFYAKNLYPIQTQLTVLRKESVKQLYKLYKKKQLFSAPQYRHLGGLLSELMDHIFEFEKTDPEGELKEIFEAIQGISYDDSVEDEFNLMKSQLEDLFDESGIDVNFDAFHSKMTPEEVAKKTTELGEQLRQQQEKEEHKQKTRKKTKKQIEQEEKARLRGEVRSKNISSIYKQLAKIFHPDLEPDEQLKLEKEELMKQLTNAYENKDLHTLLRLELVWIQKDENNADKLTDDKLSIYNEVLREQVTELEVEMSDMLYHPKYQALYEFAVFPDDIRTLNLKEEKQGMEDYQKILGSSVAKLQGTQKQALAEAKRLLREYTVDNIDDFDFLPF
jgi:hypothetical protein